METRSAPQMIDLRKFPATLILIITNVLIFILETLAGGSTKNTVAISFGAQATPFLEMGEYWRLFTAMFLHFGIVHLGCNMLSLYGLGPAIERIYGRPRYVTIYILSGLAGNLATWAVELRTGDYALSAGASGAIFGIIGAYLALFLVPSMRSRLSAKSLLIMLGINLAYGLSTPGVNMTAHIGGLIAGAAVAAVMIFVIRQKQKK